MREQTRPVRAASGSVHHDGAELHDIAALRASELRYRTLFQSSPDAAFVLRDGIIIFANPAVLRMLGATSFADLVGTPAIERVHPTFRDVALGRARRMAEGAVGVPLIEATFVKLDGSAFDVEIEATAILFDGARAVHVAVRDISARKALERAAEDESLRLRTLLSTATDGIHVIDMDGNLVLCNESFRRMLGYDEAEATTLNVRDWDAQTPEAELLPNLRSLIGQPATFETRHRRKDGSTFDVQISCGRMELGGKTYLYSSSRDITASKAAVAALRESGARYRMLTTQLQVGVLLQGPGGEIVLSNAKALELLGLTEEQLLGKSSRGPDWSVIHEDGTPYPGPTHPVEQCISTRQPVRNAVMGVYRPASRDRVWLLVNADPTLDGDGNVQEVVATLLDITSRREAEEALREQDSWHRTILGTAMDGFWSVDANGRLLQVNETYCRMSGYSEAELLAMRVHDLECGESLEAIDSHFRRVQAHGEDRFESIHRRKDGSTFAVEVSAQSRPAHDGRLVVFLRDITERKLAETTLRLKSAALDVADNAIVITTRDGTIEWANAAFSTLTGYTADEAIGRKPGDLLKSGSHDAAFFRDMWTTILSGNVWRGDLINRRKDGSLYTDDMTITPVKDALGAITHFIAVKQDITQRRILEDQLRQAQKMESVGRLAGGVAHDFNNMLGVILGHAELALLELDASQPLHDDLTEIRRAAMRSADLTRQLLAFARKQPVMPAVLNLNTTVGQSLKMLQRLIGENIQLTWRPVPNLWPVRMDPSQVDQMLANLCVNARDAIGGVGTLVLTTANCVVDARICAAHPDAVPGDYVRLTVADDGCGMNADVLTRIFEPFFTTKSVGEGTGLGLATVYGVIQQNYGFIVVTSEPGMGTTFDIHVPRHLGEMQPALETDSLGPARRGRETILVVEDESAVLRVTTRTLESHGYTVLAAHGPHEAIRTANENGGAIDLLLTDVVMPGMNGRDLADTLLSAHPHLKYLFVSGFTAQAGHGHDASMDSAHFIAKPFTLAGLTAKVREVLDRA